ncbi:UNVERIFIED_ORG: hypothetical protein J2S99_003852 [Atlantibacter hermannii]|jgi:hypothetical protein|nr:hypothetical protein [Atlantibacter hermannii]
MFLYSMQRYTTKYSRRFETNIQSSITIDLMSMQTGTVPLRINF